MPNTYSHLKAGDRVWVPAEGEWVTVVSVTSDSSWKYVKHSTQAVITSATNISGLKPDYIRNIDPIGVSLPRPQN